MDEKEFKHTYREYNERPCVFAKALLARCVGCARAQKLNIAEREAMACLSPAAHERCARLLPQMREKSLFALKLTHVEGPLPHGKEMKVQCGGLLGLHKALQVDTGERVEDVQALLDTALANHGSIEQLPFSEIVKTIVAYKLRQRGSRAGA